MIDVIHAQLSAWGKWVVRSESRSVGFPPVCPMFRDTPSGRGEGNSSPPVWSFSSAAAMDEISRIVSGLPLDMRMLCAEYYVRRGRRHGDVALRIGVHPDTLYKRLHRLHEAVSCALCCWK